VDEYANLQPSSIVRQDAIIGATLKHGGLHGAVKTGQVFLERIKSPKVDERIRAARILGDIENPQYYHPIVNLLHDEDVSIKKAAIQTIGRIKQPKLLPDLIKMVEVPRLFADISKTAMSMEDKVMPIIRSLAPNSSSSTLKKYMALASKVGGQDAITFLISGLNSDEHSIRTAGITGLHKLKYRANDDHKEIIESAVENCIDMISAINLKSNDDLLDSAIVNEIKDIMLPQLLKMLGCIYGHRVINKVAENLVIDEGDFKSNALELLENTISNHHSKRIIPLFEDDYIKANNESETEVNVETATHTIFKTPKSNISDWLKAVAIRVSRDHGITKTDHWIQKVRPIQSRILEEEVDLYIQQMA